MGLVLVALAAFYSVVLLRVLPPFARWARAGRRPWACNVCMAFWTSGVWAVSAWPTALVGTLSLEFALRLAACAGLVFLLLEAHEWGRGRFATVPLEMLLPPPPPAPATQNTTAPLVTL